MHVQKTSALGADPAFGLLHSARIFSHLCKPTLTYPAPDLSSWLSLFLDIVCFVFTICPIKRERCPY